MRASREQAACPKRSRAVSTTSSVELAHLPRVRVVVALGKIGFDAWLQLLKRRGVTRVAATAVRSRRGREVRRRAADADWLLSPESSEHQHRASSRAPMMESVFRQAKTADWLVGRLRALRETGSSRRPPLVSSSNDARERLHINIPAAHHKANLLPGDLRSVFLRRCQRRGSGSFGEVVCKAERRPHAFFELRFVERDDVVELRL